VRVNELNGNIRVKPELCKLFRKFQEWYSRYGAYCKHISAKF